MAVETGASVRSVCLSDEFSTGSLTTSVSVLTGERYSIAYHHDLLWDGPDYLKFGKAINDTRAFRSLS